MIQLKKILVATDFGEAADVALAYGRALARSFKASLHVLNVVDNVFAHAMAGEGYVAILPEVQKELEAAARKRLDEKLIDNDPDKPQTTPVVLTSSTAAYAIVQYAKDERMDLIVMGTHGRGPLAHLLMGSVAERVVRTAPCPVLTVHHPEHEFVLPDTLVAAAKA
jgi:nucleotide-binding universal stress UspA family protein